MYSDENSKLISDLYNARDREDISDILEYMGESGNSVFVYPMLDGYKRYKYSSVGYYFIWNLSRLDYPDLGKRLNELLENYEIQKEHIPMTLFFMAERRFFSKIANKMATMYLEHYLDPDFRRDFDLNCLGLNCVLSYVYRAGFLAEFEGKLRELVFAGSIDECEKTVALSFLLESNQKSQVDFLIENYASRIRQTPLEKNLAKKLLFYQTDHVNTLKNLILEQGGEEASAIIAKYGRIKAGGEDEDMIIYNCIDVATKIGIMRDQINKKSLSNKQFGFQIFPVTDLLVHQTQSLDDKALFLDTCSDLIAIVRTISPDVHKHGFNEQQAKAVLEGTPENKRDLDLMHLYLYLNAKRVGVDYDFFGFRQLHRTLELLLEDKEDRDFFEKLYNIGISQMYHKKQWHKIHGYLLNSYLQSLETMNKTFNQFVKQDLGD